MTWEVFYQYSLNEGIDRMLVFFIHGVNTQNYRYADALIKNIKNSTEVSASFYSSFWGNLFNDKKHQVIGCIERDFARACDRHKELICKEKLKSIQTRHELDLVSSYS